MIFAQNAWLATNKWEFWSLVTMLGFQLVRQWMTSRDLKMHAEAAVAAASKAEAAAIEAARRAAVVDSRQKTQGAALDEKVSQDLHATKQVLEVMKQIVGSSKNGEGP